MSHSPTTPRKERTVRAQHRLEESRVISATKARQHLAELLEDISETGKPAYIRRRSAATLLEISELSDEELAKKAEATADPQEKAKLEELLRRGKRRSERLWGRTNS